MYDFSNERFYPPRATKKGFFKQIKFEIQLYCAAGFTAFKPTIAEPRTQTLRRSKTLQPRRRKRRRICGACACRCAREWDQWGTVARALAIAGIPPGQANRQRAQTPNLYFLKSTPIAVRCSRARPALRPRRWPPAAPVAHSTAGCQYLQIA